MLGEFIYGIPELHRERMRGARLVSSAGCNATATILALYPLYKHGLVEPDRTVVEVKVGSSEAYDFLKCFKIQQTGFAGHFSISGDAQRALQVANICRLDSEDKRLSPNEIPF